MRITKFISLLFLIALTASCSSDGGGGSSGETATMTLDGSNVTLESPTAQKSENTILISADTPDGASIQLLFNKFGNLEEFSYWGDDVYNNYHHYSSHYFTFNLISLNESTHRVKVSFSGNLYIDDEDLDSDVKEVSGTFDLPYTVQTPVIPGLGLSCKIAGSNWYSTEFWDNGWSSVDRKFISDDENQIIMLLEGEDVAAGSYTFTNASPNRFRLAKYNTATKTYTEYNTTGTLSITSNTQSGFIRIIEGTYTFTATNPTNSSDVIQVTNGVFKTNF